MEWGHRILGRLIGVVFVGPLAYFAIRKRIPTSLTLRLTGLATLIGAQGLLGWYMVKSGLEDSLMDTPGAVPRVSQYRLAAHLGMAFLLYLGMFGTGMAVIKDWKYANGHPWSGYMGNNSIQKVLNDPLVRSFKKQAWVLTGLVLLTAISGKFSGFWPWLTNLTALIDRCLCCGFRRWITLQRVPVDGWTSSTSSRRALFA